MQQNTTTVSLTLEEMTAYTKAFAVLLQNRQYAISSAALSAQEKLLAAIRFAQTPTTTEAIEADFSN
jgi:hypothetical protein